MDLESLEKQLLLSPLSLLGGLKLARILKILRQNRIENFLEVGTWVGGTVYALSQIFPDIKFDTVDINDYKSMFASNQNQPLIKYLEWQLNQKISWNDLKDLQYFYRSHSPGVIFHDADDFRWNNKIYDAIFIDGDHSQVALHADLVNALENISNGFIIVDDTSFFHIRYEVEDFCKSRHLRFKFCADVPEDDLAIIRVNKDGKKRKPRFPKLKKHPLN